MLSFCTVKVVDHNYRMLGCLSSSSKKWEQQVQQAYLLYLAMGTTSTTSISSISGNGKTSAMWASLAVQRRSEG